MNRKMIINAELHAKIGVWLKKHKQFLSVCGVGNNDDIKMVAELIRMWYKDFEEAV